MGESVPDEEEEVELGTSEGREDPLEEEGVRGTEGLGGVGLEGLATPSKTPKLPSSLESLHPQIMGINAEAAPRIVSSRGIT